MSPHTHSAALRTPPRSLLRAGLMLLGLLSLAPFLGCRAPAAEASAGPPAGVAFVAMQTTAGEILLELNADRAPVTVANFLAHAERRDYDGTIFHRVIPTFVIQGGGWTADFQERAKRDAAAGRADATIFNEWQNGLKNKAGTIAMARDTAPDSATREFFINVVDNPKLDSAREKTGDAGYAVFGRVVRGLDVVERIRTGPTAPRPDLPVDDGSMNDVPVQPVVITRVLRLSEAEARDRLRSGPPIQGP